MAEQLKGQKLPETFDIRFMNQYNLPFLIHPQSRDVLIIGSGGGNDIAGALRANVNAVDAVEIDPEIINFGKKYHPEQPYSSPKVAVFNDDGRSFLKSTNKKYDVIILGLADSHTQTSSQTNVRLDNYLYTKESFEEIKQRLKPGGIVFLSFDVYKEWIGQRIQKGLHEVFGEHPVVFDLRGYNLFGWGGMMFVSGAEPGTVSKYLSQNPDLNLANLIQAKKPVALNICYIGLIISLLAQFLVPLAALNALPLYGKIAAVCLFLNLPFLFSGMIFITKLNSTRHKSAAFAANLLGSAVGGSLEMFAFLLGINSMLIFSLILFILSLLSCCRGFGGFSKQKFSNRFRQEMV